MSTRRTISKQRVSRPRARRAEQRALARGRRGRPTPEAVVAINTAVIETARKMFLTEGYSAATMGAVAKRAGVSKGTLYARFPTKETLFAAVVEAQVAEWSKTAGRQDHELAAKVSLRDRLEHHAIVVLDSSTDPQVEAFGRLLSAEAHRFPQISRIYHEVAHGFAIDILVKEIEAAAERDGIPVRNAKEAASALADSLFGWSSRKATLNLKSSPQERRHVARYRVAVLLQGRETW